MSKFATLFTEEPPESTKAKPQKAQPKKAKLQKKEPQKKTPPSTTEPVRRVGRRSDERYVQANAYIDRKVRAQVTAALALSDERLDFGELVESLLRDWLKKNGHEI